MSKTYKLNDRYFCINSGGLSREYRVELKRVEKIEETSTGFRYDGLLPHKMYDTFEEAIKRAISLTEEQYKKDIERLEDAKEPTERRW